MKVESGPRRHALLSPEHCLIGEIAGADWSPAGKRLWHFERFGEIDWQRVSLLAGQHKIRPMLAAALRESRWVSVPPPIRRQIEENEVAYARKTIALLSTLTNVASHTRKLGLRVLALKGPGLSFFLYGNPLIRESFDLDLLVHQDDLNGLREVLSRENIFPVLGPPLSRFQTAVLRRFNKHEEFRNAANGFIVECHHGLDHNPWRLRTDFDLLWDRRRSIVLAGETIHLLGGMDLTQYLCVHAARHGWDRWKWLGDLAALSRLVSPTELAEHRQWADACGNLPIFDASCLLAANVTGIGLPDSLRQDVNSNRKAVAIANRALRLTTSCQPEQNKASLYLFRQMIARLKLKPSLRCIGFEAVVLAHRPSDWYDYRLPDSMIWAYYLLRLTSLVRRGIGGRN